MEHMAAADRSTERERAVAALPEASARLVRTVDGFHGDDWLAPSLLPDWTRAHVVAHLGLNATALHDIAELADLDASDIRGRLLAGVTLLQEAIDAVPADRWDTRVERTPGGRTMRAGAFPGMRWRELEIHHVDLDAGYQPSGWSIDFAEHLLDAMTKRLAPEQPFEVKPLDSKRSWLVGDGESEYPVPVVTGPAADLGWWLTGRPTPDSVSCSRGELPSIEGW
jgi:maleylpyruvate isomerase